MQSRQPKSELVQGAQKGSTAHLADPSESVMRIMHSMAMLVALAMPSLMVNSIKIVKGGLCSFLFSLFYFYFSFFYSLFLFLEQLRLGVISHAVTSVTT